MESGPISIAKMAQALRELQPLLEQQNADELVLLDVASAELEISLLDVMPPAVAILERLTQHDNPLLLKTVNELLQKLQPGPQLELPVVADLRPSLPPLTESSPAQPVRDEELFAAEVAAKYSEEISKLKRLLEHYNNDPSDSAFNNILNFLISLQSFNKRVSSEERKLVENAFKELFNKAKFENLSHQRSILAYMNDRTIDEAKGLPFFHELLLGKSRDYEEKVINRLCQNKDGKEIAQDLRQHFFKMMGKIKRSEFTDLAWSKKDGKEKAPNVYQISDELNKLSFLVIHDILLARPEERVIVFEKYCRVLAHAINNNDTGLVNAIYSGMNAAEIKRLNLQNQVKNKHDIRALMFITDRIVSSDGSFKAQRKIEKQAIHQKQAIVPSITTLLNDLTFAHDGNLDAKGNLKLSGKEKMSELIDMFSEKQALAQQAVNTKQDGTFSNRISSTAYVFDSRTGIKRSQEILPPNNKKLKPSEMKSIEFYLIERLEKVSSNLNSNITAQNLTFERVNKRINDVEILIEENALTKDEYEKFISFMIASEAIQGLRTSIKESEATVEAVDRFIKENPNTPDLAKLSAFFQELKNDIIVGWQIIEDAKVYQNKLKEAQVKATEHRQKVQPESVETIPVQVQTESQAPEEVKETKEDSEPEIMISNDDELPAERILESLLKKYNIKVYESKNSPSKVKQEQTVAIIQEIDEQINYLINKVNANRSSIDPKVQSDAVMATAKMKGMIERYQELRNFLQSTKTAHDDKPLKSIATRIKRAVTNVKSLRQKKSAEKRKDLLGLINALREETHKRTREERLEVKSEAKPTVDNPAAIKPALVQPNAQRKPKRQVHFADDEEKAVAEPNAKQEPQGISPAVDQEPSRTLKPRSNPSQHRVVFSNDLLALESLKEKLADSDPEVRNSILLQAMKQSVELLKNLPPTHKPKSFGDIVRFATNNISDWQNIHEVQRKKASEVVLSVIISPNASIEELKKNQEQLQARVRMLKNVQPLTQQIRNKIVLREAVLLHLNKLIIEKSVAHQARPSAVRLSADSATESHSMVAPSSAVTANDNTRETNKPTK